MVAEGSRDWRAEAGCAGIRVLIVEGHEFTRRGLAALLSPISSVRVVGAVSRPELSSDYAAEGGIDVLVVASDLEQPAFEVLVSRLSKDVRVVVLIRSNEPEQLDAAARKRAHGYVVEEGLESAKLEAVLAEVMAGRLSIPAPLVDRLLERTRDGQRRVGPPLRPMEINVLRLLRDGSSNKEIACELGMSFHAAKRHVGSVLMKLGTPNRTAAATRGVELGWLSTLEQPLGVSRVTLPR